MFLSILTSNFKDLGPIDAKAVSYLAIGLCVLFFLVGIGLSVWRVHDKSLSGTAARDKAVDEIIKTYLTKQ